MRFHTYDVSHGLQSNEFDSGACMRSRNCEMFYGACTASTCFAPPTVRDNPKPPPVVVTGFDVFNRPVPVDLSGKKSIDLTYQENFISFDFAALDYRARKNLYAYKLEGFDKDLGRGGRPALRLLHQPAGRQLHLPGARQQQRRGLERSWARAAVSPLRRLCGRHGGSR